MRRRLIEVLGVVAIILAVIVLLKVAPFGVAGQAPASGGIHHVGTRPRAIALSS